MDSKILRTVSASLAALNFDDENGRIAAIQADIAKAEEALALGEARLAELATGVASAPPDGGRVAERLLQGADAWSAAAMAPTAEARESERAALNAGTRELRRRIDDARREIETIHIEARGKVATAMRPVVDAALAEMRDAAERLTEAYSAIAALAITCRAFGEQESAAGKVVRVAMTELKCYRRELDVPKSIADLVAAVPKATPAPRLTPVYRLSAP